MIWCRPDAAEPDRALLETHLLEEIHVLCGDSVSVHVAAEVAHGIAAYWEQVLHRMPLASDYVAFLVARAMDSVGADAAADAAMKNQNAAAFRSDLLQYLPAGEVSLQTWRMFTSLLVRPTRWMSYGDDVVWVLDFSRLRFDDNHCFELSFTEGLRGVLLQLAKVWGQTDGQGALGVKGVAVLQSAYGGQDGRDEGVDVIAFCRDILKAEAEKRGWTSIPRVLPMDAAVSKPAAKKTSGR